MELSYVSQYNKHKKKHRGEKELMRLSFETELVKSQLELQEQTMQTIGADLHDNIGQLLSLTTLTLNSIRVEDAENTQQKIDAALDLTGRSLKEMRLLGKLLQGDQLISMGLDKAIQYELSWLEKAGQFEVRYSIEGEKPANANNDKELILFRILQEILNNSIKHAQAKRINIKIIYHENQLLLQVEDNGIGFKVDELVNEARGMGLLNMKKRSEIIGGTLTINSNANQGTTVIINVPYP